MNPKPEDQNEIAFLTLLQRVPRNPSPKLSEKTANYFINEGKIVCQIEYNSCIIILPRSYVDFLFMRLRFLRLVLISKKSCHFCIDKDTGLQSQHNFGAFLQFGLPIKKYSRFSKRYSFWSECILFFQALYTSVLFLCYLFDWFHVIDYLWYVFNYCFIDQLIINHNIRRMWKKTFQLKIWHSAILLLKRSFDDISVRLFKQSLSVPTMKYLHTKSIY